jgi:hypothetical protein
MIQQAIRDALTNDVLWVSIAASILAQFLKPFTFWMRSRVFDWHHIAETGGMPSSHSALVCALATGLGLEQGFGSPTFALAVGLATIVTYDAGGVRRQAGEHARVLNTMVAELLSGHAIEEMHLKEVLGHSRMEVLGGILFGIVLMLVWKLSVQAMFGGV